MNRSVRQTIKTYCMLQRGECVVVGVSGGADSVALLHFLCTLRQQWGLQLLAAHLNHSLRGEESMRDARHVRQLCRNLDVPLYEETLDIRALARRAGQSLELCAREQRYAFFVRAAQTLGGGAKIATAHTLDDSLETVLLNLARGTALRGLCGIPPVRGQYIRPLIEVTREQVERYCAQHALPYVTDSSNLQDVFSRNRVRHQAVPVLRALNPSLAQTARGMLRALREDADYLDALAREAVFALRRPGNVWSRTDFLRLPRPVAMRVLLHLLERQRVPYDHARLLRLYRRIAAGTGGEQLGPNCFFVVRADRFGLRAANAPVPLPCVAEQTVTLQAGRQEVYRILPDKSVRIAFRDYEYCANFQIYEKNLLKNALDCDKIEGIVKIRLRRPGDALRPAGRGCTKTLKKLFNEAGLPHEVRGRTVVLADAHGPVWVEGFGPAQRVAVSDATRRLWLLQVLEDEKTKGDSNQHARRHTEGAD